MKTRHRRPVVRRAHSDLDTFVELTSDIGLTLYGGAALLKQNLTGG